MSNRSGTYIQQLTGYKAFIPRDLPPDPPIQFTADLQKLLSRADRELGRLDGSISTLPNPDLFIAMYVRREAVLSSQIEGTQSSLHDVLAVEADMAGKDTPGDVGEVINYVSALNHGLARLSELPVSIRLIREIHKELLKDGRGKGLTPGELRKTPVWIGPPGSNLNNAVFIPPPPDKVGEALSDLERFIQPGESDLPLLVVIGLAHAQFETIHPFLDGNGRLGRLLITFLLAERGVLTKPVLYLSHYFKKYRQIYYEKLQAVRDEGDWEGWLSFYLEGMIQVAGEAATTAREILVLREADRNKIVGNLGRGAGNGNKLLEALYDSPLITVKIAQRVTGISYAASNNLVAKFVEMDILEEHTGNSRNRRFKYTRYLRLFDGD